MDMWSDFNSDFKYGVITIISEPVGIYTARCLIDD